MSEGRPIEVAVVGGGCAGVTAAFELTRPEHRGRYRVTLYQSGWRLGGKGASGRGPADRIEEHGLHLWLGFYENAFRLMRDCYAELDRDPRTCRLASWRDAFEPASFVGMADPTKSGEWERWLAFFPPGAGEPGDPLHRGNPFTVRGYLVRSARLLRALYLSVQDGGRDPAANRAAGDRSPLAAPEELLAGVSRLLRFGRLATLAAMVEGATLLEGLLGGPWPFPQEPFLRLAAGLAAGARAELDRLTERDAEVRRFWEVIDLLLAFMRGALRFGLLTDPRGFDVINDYDVREWLLLNGAARASVDSTFVRALYDLALAYEDGDPDRPRLAAGGGLRGALRMFFTYRGALFWRMRAGMGDVVFAPLYQVLRRRGVRFRFFHRLTNVGIGAPTDPAAGDRPHVETLEFDVQARIRGGGEYRPLVDVRGLPCWPARPDFSQLVAGRRLEREGREFESHWDRRQEGTRTLRVTEDFDLVVLAVGLGAVPHVCREILQRDRRWRTMVGKVKTVATQAFQIWMQADMEELGWREDQVNLSGFVKPFDTWADMRHLIAEESWRAPPPRALAYFCSTLAEPRPGAFEDAAYPAGARELVRRNAVRFLETEIAGLWPRAAGQSGGFRWEILVDPDGAEPGGGRADASRFDSQFWTANVNPTDRYVMSVPGSMDSRISPLDTGYDNLTVAGDWTDNGHNEACVEAAVMSGLLAAHAVSGRPALEEIIGYDHP